MDDEIGVQTMPVFDFNHTPEAEKDPECTYTVFYSNKHEASLEDPILLLDNRKGLLQHHSSGSFTNPVRGTAFEWKEEEGTKSVDILQIDARFISLLKWMGENHINVRLSGADTENGYAVYKSGRLLLGEAPNFLLRMDFYSL